MKKTIISVVAMLVIYTSTSYLLFAQNTLSQEIDYAQYVEGDTLNLSELDSTHKPIIMPLILSFLDEEV